jgi:hypothetical protein
MTISRLLIDVTPGATLIRQARSKGVNPLISTGVIASVQPLDVRPDANVSAIVESAFTAIGIGSDPSSIPEGLVSVLGRALVRAERLARMQMPDSSVMVFTLGDPLVSNARAPRIATAIC